MTRFIAHTVATVAMISAFSVAPAHAYVSSGLVFDIDARDASSFDPQNPTVWLDISGSNDIGVVYGVSYDEIGNTMDFSGTTGCGTEHIAFGERSFDFSQGMSIDFSADFRTTDNFERIIDFGNGQLSDNILVSRYGSEDNVALAIYLGGSSWGAFTTTGNPLSSPGTHHLTVTVDDTHVAHWYVDGIEVPTQFNGASSTDGQDIIALPQTVSRQFNEIGMSQWCDRDFDGTLDYVRIYERGLTADEVAANFANDSISDAILEDSDNLASTGFDALVPTLLSFAGLVSGVALRRSRKAH
ncbi:MAG: LamG-like jellyroll fold domain-containing protein [Microbacteriaceae bacterium]